MFKSLNIDLEKGIYQLNGEDIGDNVSKLNLEFENGKWLLRIEQTLLHKFTAPSKRSKEFVAPPEEMLNELFKKIFRDEECD